MNITVLDGSGLNPGDLSWEEFRKYGNLTVYPQTKKEEMILRAKDSEIIIVNKLHFGAEEFDALPLLKYIGVTATGYNNIDTEEAAKRGIIVTNVPSYGTESVAQFVFALLLELCHSTSHHISEVKKGRWNECPIYCFWDGTLTELAGKTMGIVGLGRIGEKTADIAAAFGMKVLYNARKRHESADKKGYIYTDLEELLKSSDVVSLHCPLTKDTEHLIDEKALRMMKKDAILINTSRGPIIDEEALYDALRNHEIRAAGLDVLTEEPPKHGSPLFELENCIITPHIAWAAHEARGRLMDTVRENLEAWLNGRPQNTV